MTREPPGDVCGAKRKGEGALGPWQVARAEPGRATAASPLAPQARIGESATPWHDAIKPRAIVSGMASDPHITDDLDAVSLLPGSWPRVFPGL
jgi:hypothetical protein